MASELQGKPVEVANELIVADGTEEAYEAFVEMFAQPPFGPQAREWLDRHRRMVAWNDAVIVNTAAAYRAFVAEYPDSDLAATARKLEERLRNRPEFRGQPGRRRRRFRERCFGRHGGGRSSLPTNASLAAPTCPCGGAPSLPLKKVDLPPKSAASRTRRSAPARSRRVACARSMTRKS